MFHFHRLRYLLTDSNIFYNTFFGINANNSENTRLIQHLKFNNLSNGPINLSRCHLKE